MSNLEEVEEGRNCEVGLELVVVDRKEGWMGTYSFVEAAGLRLKEEEEEEDEKEVLSCRRMKDE